MKLIGITGKSGAGKTTFSNYLTENSEEIDVIHIDDLLRQIKLKYFKLIMKKDKFGDRVKVDSNLKKFIYSNKYLFLIFMKIRAKLVEPLLNRRIKELKGKRIVLIDDIFLKHHKIYDILEQIYIIERPYIDRTTALKQRENLKKEEVVAYDTAHYTNNYREIKDNKRVIKVENKGDKSQLRQKARCIYLERMLSRREKMIRNIKLSNLNKPKVHQRQHTPRIIKGEFLR